MGQMTARRDLLLPSVLPLPQSFRLSRVDLLVFFQPSSCTCINRSFILQLSPAVASIAYVFCSREPPGDHYLTSFSPRLRSSGSLYVSAHCGAGSEITMLLPPAFPCEGTVTQMRPPRPKLLSMTAYQPPQTQIQHAQSGLIASCRALQTMLGNSLPSPRLLSRTPKKELRNPFEASFAQSIQNQQPPRGANKRRRDDFEADKENFPIHEDKTYSTPKRQRRVPLAMPLGLSAADFQALEPSSLSSSPTVSLPDPSSPPHSSDDNDSGYGPSPPPSEDGTKWTIDDDRVLVETVLEKLQLSKRAWNDCARRLGKDKDSLGRRWRMLVDEGNVGLKRGGCMRRTSLDIGSW